ncbi:DUF7933 domain-containing protein [Thermostichus sp. OS-CIW-30]
MKTGKVAGVLACLCLGLLTACQQTKERNPISSLPGPIIPVQNPNTEPGGTGVGLPSTPPLPTPNPSPSIIGLPPGPLAAPTFTKQFVPNPTTNGNVVTVVFTITNTATVPITGLSFIDILPNVPASGLQITTPAVTSNTCGGTLTANAGTTTISLAGGSLAAGASCVVSVSVEQAPPLPPPPPLPVTYTNPPVTLLSNGAPPAISGSATVTFTP